VTLAETAQLISRRSRRLAIALSFATALTGIGTFVLLKADAPPVLACVLATALGVAVLMQVLSPGSGIALHDRVASSSAAGRAEPEPPVLTPPIDEPSVLETVREEVAAVLELESAEDVQPDSLFRTLGVDSVQAMELRERLEAAVGFQLPIELVYKQPTVAALVHFLWMEIQARAEFGADEGAFRDPVTGLPTCDYLRARLAELEGEARRRNTHFALAVLEVRTATGDTQLTPEAVTTAARRLSRAVRGGDTLVRIGPSKFVIVLALSETDVHEVYAAGARLVNAFSRGDDPELKVSVGVAIHENGMLGAELIRAAVAALHSATEAGSFGVGVANRERFGRRDRGRSTEADPVSDEEDAP
jgi:GGDEF domain-containing protein